MQILFYVFCIHPLGSSLYIAVEHFIGKFASPAANSVTAIVNSIDESLWECSPYGDIQTREPQVLPHSSEFPKEVEALQVENEALKAQLSKELDELKQENYTLKQKLRRLELQHENTAGPELQTNQSQTNQSQTNQSSELYHLKRY